MRSLLCIVLAALLLPPSARADGGFRIAGNQLVTWLEADELPPPTNWVRPERVFDGDLAEVNGVISLNAPGFHGEDGTLTGYHLGFNVLAAARVWNGQDFNSPSPLSFEISAPFVGGLTTPPVDPPAPIIGPNVLVPPGEFDFHYDYTLNGTTPGLYLLKLQITTDRPGIAPSLPYWVVQNYNMPEAEKQAAIAWVRTHLVGVAPPDSSGATAAVRLLWPPDHEFVPVHILGIQGDGVAIEITGITQDEPVRDRAS